MPDRVYKLKPKEDSPETIPEPTLEERLFWHCRRIESIKKAIVQNEKRREMAWEEYIRLQMEYVQGFDIAIERLTAKLDEAEGVLCDMLMAIPNEKKRKYKMGRSTYYPATSPGKVVVEDEAGAVAEIRASGKGEGLIVESERVDKKAFKARFSDEEGSPGFEFIKVVPGKTSLRTRRN